MEQIKIAQEKADRWNVREKHIRLGKYLKDVVFAANDGIITTFAVVAGVVGASLSSTVILIVGFASLIADGFSMATGNYLGTKSEHEFYKKEEKLEYQETEEVPEVEIAEVKEILEKKGYKGDELEQITRLVTSNKQFWVEFMMHEELGLFAPDSDSPVKNGLVTFVSFILAGSVPLIPYVAFSQNPSFALSAAFTGTALFAVGAMRKFFSGKSWILSGLEMLLVGGSAAILAYAIGFALRALLG